MGKYSVLEPMWSTQKNRLPQQDVPVCERCQKPRNFEMQIMPQLFTFVEELAYVDWDTIAVYTCQNLDCMPDFSKGEHYAQEYGYI